jgi:alginate O-acetyltransferase complex protein AlgI
LPFIVFLLLVIWFAPNTQQYMEGYQPVLPYEKAKPTLPSPSTLNSSLNSSFFNKLRWKPNQTWALISGIITALALLNLERVSEFLYFNF